MESKMNLKAEIEIFNFAADIITTSGILSEDGGNGDWDEN